MGKELKDFNLNDYFLVKLNDDGYQHLADKHNDILKCMPNFKPKTLEDYKAKADENGYTRFQAWDFINQFGDKMGMGFNNPVNPNIKIEFDVKEIEDNIDTTQNNIDLFIGIGIGIGCFISYIIILIFS